MKKKIFLVLLSLLFLAGNCLAQEETPLELAAINKWMGVDIAGWTSIDLSTNYLTTVDTGSFITAQTSSRITWVDLDRNVDCYSYKDYGAAYFNTDFTFRFVILMENSAETSMPVHYFILGNELDDADSHTDRISLRGGWTTGTSEYYILLGIRENAATADSDNTIGTYVVAASTPYYITVTRNKATDTYTAYIRTGSHTGTLRDTLSATCTDCDDFRYLYAINNENNASTGYDIDGYIENMEWKPRL
jgi:hypothetical protein